MPRSRTSNEGTLFGGGEIPPRRRWLAIVAASMVMQFAYWPAVTALAASHEDQPIPTELLLFGLALVPLTFLVLAFGSRHRQAPSAVLRAMGLFVAAGAAVVLLNPIVGLVAAFGAGGAAALRRPGGSRPWSRVVALVAACLYLLVLLLAGAGDFAIVSAAALPLVAVGLADEVDAGRAPADDEAP
ncbi:hypothetical protein [Egicoccus halophilus]|uniref:Uncharacterized protein n=1 Tax=Egicoccus halophilus TaxID=1670830 RepID=A0A8J3AAM5_9ACTN|nr:hypothetical protein [Egicoccus halophilus]GGI06739.1 hypothetical protein GCM10011354_20600 [Egicoccus halophilus]